MAAGCGGGNDKDAQALLRRGFAAPINSANVTVDISAQVNGVPALSKPIRVKLAGPYQTNGPKKLPSLNWDLSLSGGGQTFSAGFITTGDNAFVNFQGTNYDVGAQAVAKLNQQLAQRNPTGRTSLKQFGIDPIDWVTNASDEGESTVAGVTTKHVSAGLDVSRLFNDLNKSITQARGAVPGAAPPAKLTQAQIDQIKNVVHDPKFDVYVGKADGKIRRVSLNLDFEVPKSSQSSTRGISGGNVSVSVEFAAVGEPQHIAAPTGAKPISQLTQQLGGLGGLTGALGGAGAGGPTGGTGGTGGSGGAGGTAPNSAQFKSYSDCLNKAKPSDVAAIQHCAALLK
jgi:hypothetical protein